MPAAADRVARRFDAINADSRTTPEGLQLFVAAVQRMTNAGYPPAGLFPGETDGLRAEWRGGRRSTVLEVNAAGSPSCWHFDFIDGSNASAEDAASTDMHAFLQRHIP